MTDHEPCERSIFQSAIEKGSAAERAEYLDEACRGDARLRAGVEALLAAHDRLGGGCLPGTADLAPPDRPGTVVGAYKLLEQIGEGGFGVVFLAEQTQPVRRKVALKVLKPGMDSRQVLARFEAERQALAIMDHPNIARVLDGGATASGRPYFVMELVKGVPITEFCDQDHLTTRQRLELFVQVCRAVQHAHQKGIIHRDLKPSNVLVSRHDSTPVTKVIDFGVAKALGQELTDKTLFTGVAQMIGTPLYMSPEQAGMSDLDVDTRSDVYSLGVLLYELLTGTTPFTRDRFKKAAYDEIRRIIREEEPPRPSTRLSESRDALPSISAQRQTEPAELTRLVRGELDWIVMKALEKDRDRRYETANAFAADVHRYLADEPVQACPPSLTYRLRKFTCRNRAAVVAMSAVFLSLVGGVVGTTVGLVRAVNAEGQAVASSNQARESADREREAKEQALAAKQDAERNLARAIEAADTFFTKVSENKLLDKPALLPFRKELLEEARKQYRELFHRNPGDAKLQAKVAASYLRLVLVLTGLEASQEAVAPLREGVELAERLVRENRGDPEVARALSGVFTSERPISDGGPNGFARRGLASCQELVERACRVWKGLAADHPEIPTLRADYAILLGFLGDIHGYWERHTESVVNWHEADEVLRDLLARSGLNCEYRTFAALNRCGLGLYRSWKGEDAEGPRLVGEAIRMLEQLVREFPERPWLRFFLICSITYSAELFAQSRPLETDLALRRCLEMNEALVAAEPDVPAYFRTLCAISRTHGTVLDRRGRLPEAESRFRRALDDATKVIARFPDDGVAKIQFAEIAGLYAEFLVRHDRRREALPHFEAAYRIHEDRAVSSIRNSWEIGARRQVSSGLYSVLIALGRPDEARAVAKKTSARAQEILADMPDLPSNHTWLAEWYATQGEWNSAIDVYSGAIKRWPGRSDLRDLVARSKLERGKNLQRAGRASDAERDFRDAIEIWTRLTSDFPDQTAHLRNATEAFQYRLTPVLESTGRSAEVEELLKQSLPEWTRAARHQDRSHQAAIADVTGALARVQAALGKRGEAVRTVEGLVEQWSESPHAFIARGRLRLSLGEPTGALEDFTKAAALEPQGWVFAHMKLWRSQAFTALNQPERALAELTEATESWPKLFEPWAWRGWYYRDKGRLDKAVADFNKAMELNPGELEPLYQPIWRDRAEINAQLGNWDHAIRDYDRAIELQPDYANSHAQLAYLLAHCPDERKRDAMRSVELARRAVALQPKVAGHHRTLGSALYRMGDWKGAIDELTQAVALRKGAGSELFFLAMAYERLGQHAEALKWYREAAAWTAKNPPKIEEPRRLQQETEQLLGVNPPGPGAGKEKR